jgi:hypothetical protein
MKRRAWAAGTLACSALALSLAASPALAQDRLSKLRGHLSVGYAKLFAAESPAGSFSLGAGLDYPLAGEWRVGVSLGFDLLGGRVVERGSLTANVDYSMLEVLALAHWESSRLGPIGRLSLGPGLISARAELSTAGGGASFSDLAVQEVAPGFSVRATLMRRKDSPVRIGFEAGVSVAFLESETWSVAAARLAFHY